MKGFRHFSQRLVLLYLLYGGQLACAEEFSNYQEFIILSHAERYVSDQTQPPSTTDWEATELPEFWRSHHERNILPGEYVWYRFKLSNEQTQPLLASAEGKQLSILVSRNLISLRLWLNGDFLGENGNMHGYRARNWNKSTVFPVVSSAWNTEGDNLVYAQLYGYGRIATMPPLMIGAHQEIEALAKWQNFLRQDLSRAAWVIELSMTIFCAFIWWRRRSKIYLYLALVPFFSSFASLYGFSQSVAIHQDWVLKIVHWSIDASICAMVLFAHQLFNRRFDWFDRLLIGYPIILAFSHSIYPALNLVNYLNLVHLLSYSLLLYLFVFCLRGYIRLRKPEALFLCLGIVCLFLSSAHGLSLSLTTDMARWVEEFHTQHLAMLPMMTLLIMYISREFIQSMQRTESLNNELSTRVALIRAELQQSFKDKKNIEQQTRIERAREQVYQDVHDDLGARILSLIYSSENIWRNDLARSALQDLRDVVSNPARATVTLEDCLADILYEQTERAERFNVAITQAWGESETTATHYKVSLGFQLFLKQFTRELFGNLLHVERLKKLDVKINGEGRELLLEITASYDDKSPLAQLSPVVIRRLKKLNGTSSVTTAEDHNHYLFRIPTAQAD